MNKHLEDLTIIKSIHQDGTTKLRDIFTKSIKALDEHINTKLLQYQKDNPKVKVFSLWSREIIVDYTIDKIEANKFLSHPHHKSISVPLSSLNINDLRKLIGLK